MENNSETYPGYGLPKLRVRTANNYQVPKNVDLGQRNATIVKRVFTPLRRFIPWSMAVAPLPDLDHDLVHSINSVPLLTPRPYIITYESLLPRVLDDRHRSWLEPWLQQRMLGDQCVALLAMSQYALRQFRWQNRNYAERKSLEHKMEVFYPAVPLRLTEPKRLSGQLKLLFVGADFMRKGGPALLRAHKQLKHRGVPVETTIVSSLQWRADDYIGPPSEEYVLRETAELKQEGVVHHPGLPNADVLRLMQVADYFVFPTLHDTFGYAPLEALSCATPVLATNTCAQPEIVANGRCGYLLPFENDEDVGKWKYISRNREADYVEVYNATIERLGDAITDRLMDCWESRDGYEAMSAGAIDQVRSRFNMEQARFRLEELYEVCRNR